MAELRPRQILREIGHQFPQTWNQVKTFRAGKGNDLPDWPDWCYIPLAAGYAIASANGNIFGPFGPAVITAAAAWRVSQGVYRFDADLYNELVNQPMDDKIPCEALKRLPEYCMYIETIAAKFHNFPMLGFWAHLESDANDGRVELRLVIMREDGQNIPISIHLGDWSLEEGLARMQAEAIKYVPKGFTLPAVDYVEDVSPLINLVLYLCSDNVDMKNPPVHPKNRVRLSGQVDVSKEPRFWTVGERIGSAIHNYRNANQNTKANSDLQGTHDSPRPHMRRAHWHSFWTGPYKGDRTLVVRWLPPIPVGVSDNENELPVVIHEVK